MTENTPFSSINFLYLHLYIYDDIQNRILLRMNNGYGMFDKIQQGAQDRNKVYYYSTINFNVYRDNCFSVSGIKIQIPNAGLFVSQEKSIFMLLQLFEPRNWIHRTHRSMYGNQFPSLGFNRRRTCVKIVVRNY